MVLSHAIRQKSAPLYKLPVISFHSIVCLTLYANHINNIFKKKISTKKEDKHYTLSLSILAYNWEATNG